ncbi:hypothetical protein [Aquipseudomonas alcaligenes]|jgi:hypothetical protein|uniref:hypothetical protein n=1 Tax=Aquipseudomonas alcaligenes TaxID=43263 RepID=UPI0011156079|nr:hypothetical protein [Pseudomonas alcaligenes]
MKKLLISITLLTAIFTQASAEPTPEEWAEKYDAIQHDVCKNIKGECLVNYSVYDVDERGLPINNLNDIAIEGKIIVLANHNPFWGKGSDYKSQVLENPSWRELAVIANEVIVTTGDLHHAYLEGFEITRKINETTFIELVFGS